MPQLTNLNLESAECQFALRQRLRMDVVIHKEDGAVWWENAALREAAFGNYKKARQAAARGLKMAPEALSTRAEAALAFSMSADTARAQSIANDLRKQYHTSWTASRRG